MSDSFGMEPRLSPDFAVRVLEAADRVVKRRRRLRGLAVVSVFVAGISGTVFWSSFFMASQSPTQTRYPMFAAASPAINLVDVGTASARQDNAPDALSWFFPDAQPLARYSADDTSDDGADTAATLFTDDE